MLLVLSYADNHSAAGGITDELGLCSDVPHEVFPFHAIYLVFYAVSPSLRHVPV